MIKIRDLSYAYEGDQPALSRVDLDLRPGEWVSILGGNGSGKSTLLKCIIGLLKPSSGTVTIDGVAVAESSLEQSRIGLVFQNPDDQIISPVVESEIAFGLENLGVPHDEMVERVEETLDKFGLTRYQRSDPHLLSGGERQRLAIASIVVTRPDFILFDEPFSMLDAATRDDLTSLIRKLRDDGVTPIVVGQDPDESLCADRLLVCSAGEIIEDGDAHLLLSHPDDLRQHGLASTTAGRLSHALGMPAPVPVTEAELVKALDPGFQVRVPSQPNRETGQITIIEVRGLRFAYDLGLPTEHLALDGIDLVIKEGESVSLIGPSGSGKSTFALHLNGLLTPTSGSLQVCGLDVSDTRSQDELRRKVGLVFQFPESQLFAETVADDVAYGPRNHEMDNIQDRVDTALQSVGLNADSYRDRNPFSLSGGEKRRVALAGVLATSPQILVLDEPTAGLDPSGADELDGILQSLSDTGVTLILVTHDLERAAALTDRTIGVLCGKLAFDEPSRTTFAQDDHLRLLGITPPTGICLLRSLRASGVALPESALTSDELVAALALLQAPESL
ncbi:MAG: energy-coupling factor transporter ATPase [Candidatus Latescibacterota bacterium]|nr:energy-coupling factor transporter ATPase [Candidatus Latescibacterota bacterium]